MNAEHQSPRGITGRGITGQRHGATRWSVYWKTFNALSYGRLRWRAASWT